MDYRDKIVQLMQEKGYVPRSEAELVQHFALSGKEIGAFISQLDELYERGKVFRTKQGTYVLASEAGIVVGTLSRHKKGFGFVSPAEETGEREGTGSGGDIYVAEENMRQAMHGDLVAVKLLKGEGASRRGEGAVARIIRRAHPELAGTFYCRRGYGFLVPDDPRIAQDVFVSQEHWNDVRSGDKAVVNILRWPDGGHSAEGEVIEIISRKGEPGGDIKTLLRCYQKSEAFPELVRKEAQAGQQSLPQRTQVQWQQAGRRDMRGQTVITIDGAGSKDFDDAVSLQQTPQNTWLLSVHIADVAHYVTEGSALDREAWKRGTSIYPLNQVIPMLPKELSNGICSLNPKEERLALSVDMEIDERGRVIRHEIYESVICSQERMVYDDVSDLLDFWNDRTAQTADAKGGKCEREAPCAEGTADAKKTENADKAGADEAERTEQQRLLQLSDRYAHIKEMLLEMERLALVLQDRREERGSIDFDLAEAEILLNDDGIAVEIGIASRRIANRMIEEFMLAANETVAEHFYWLGVPFIYRVHEKPEAEKISSLRRFLSNFGIPLKGSADSLHPRTLNEILKQAEGMEEEHVIHSVTLRAMQKAFYGTECLGHFGLSLTHYCHFTSPIRRYPDLMIHRIIKETLREPLTQERDEQLQQNTAQAAKQASLMECQAQELERDAQKMKMAEYMSQHIGEVFDGVISGVSNFGFFVQLSNTVEGLVRLCELADDFYDCEPERYRLIGRRYHNTYNLGQRVCVCVQRADAQSREIDFSLVEDGGSRYRRRRYGASAQSGREPRSGAGGATGTTSNRTAERTKRKNKKIHRRKETPRGVPGRRRH